MVALGALMSVYARLTDVWSAVVVIGLFSLALGSLNAVSFPLILQVVPREFLGRTMSVFQPMNRLASIVSIALVSFLLSTVLRGFAGSIAGMHVGPIDTLFTAGGVLIAAAGLYARVTLGSADRAPSASGDEPTETVAV
jgi:fucose permease